MDLLFTPVPYEEAIDFIKSKPIVSREVFNELLPELKGRAFTVTGLEGVADVMQAVRDRIADLPAGANWDDVKRDIADDISPYLVDPNADPEERDAQINAANRRAELLLRTHGHAAYAAAQYEVMDRQRDVFPYWEYHTMEDDRVRPEHAALDQIVLPAAHEFWQTHYPPWDWGCRCYVVPLSESDRDDLEEHDAEKPRDEQNVLVDDPEADELTSTRRLYRDGKVIDVSSPAERGKEGAFEWHPGNLRLSTGDLKERYDAPVWAAFEMWARNTEIAPGYTVYDWISNVKPPAVRAGLAEAAAEKPSGATETSRQKISNARFTRTTRLGGGINTSLKLGNGETVVFKPKSGEHEYELRTGVPVGTQYLREKAASIVDEYLGTNLVPPTEIIQHEGEIGSAQIFRKGMKTLGDTGRSVIKSLPEKIKHAWQLLDDVLQHLDRHEGNLLVRVRAGKATAVSCIDNGLSLSEHQGRKRFWGPLEGKPISDENIDRLIGFKNLESEIRKKLKPLLGQSAIDNLFARVDRLIDRKTYGDFE